MASGDSLALFTPHLNQPPSTNYANFNTRNGNLVLEFDPTTQWTAVFPGIMPKNYSGGNVTVAVSWMAATATSGTIGWDVAFERDNDGNHDLDGDAFAATQTITAATVDAVSGKLKTTSVSVTAGATNMDNIAAGDPFRLRIRRDVANDNAAGLAQLFRVQITEN